MESLFFSLEDVPMTLNNDKVQGVKVINIFEENAEAIEKMVNKVILEINQQGKAILEIQTTGDNMFFFIGEGEATTVRG